MSSHKKGLRKLLYLSKKARWFILAVLGVLISLSGIPKVPQPLQPVPMFFGLFISILSIVQYHLVELENKEDAKR
jgi:divalent metal cation (Fe/Co/Zn/Cd) transporter